MIKTVRRIANLSPPKMKRDPHAAARSHRQRAGNKTPPFRRHQSNPRRLRYKSPTKSFVNTGRLKWSQVSAQTYTPHRFPPGNHIPNQSHFGKSPSCKAPFRLCPRDFESDKSLGKSNEGRFWSSSHLEPDDPNPRLATSYLLTRSNSERYHYPSHGPLYDNTRKHDICSAQRGYGGQVGTRVGPRNCSGRELWSVHTPWRSRNEGVGRGSDMGNWRRYRSRSRCNMRDSGHFPSNDDLVHKTETRPINPLPLHQRSNGGVGQMVANFRPQPGDIIILQCERIRTTKSSPFGGLVALYSDDNFFRTLIQDRSTLNTKHAHEFLKGDIVVRMGCFDQNWKWHLGELVQVFLCESKYEWWMVSEVSMPKSIAGKLGCQQHSLHSLSSPPRGCLKYGEKCWPDPRLDPAFVHIPKIPEFSLEKDHTTIPFQDIYFKPREGDLIINGLPSIENIKKWEVCWWRKGLETKHFDMLLRVDIKAQRKPHGQNLTEVLVEMYWLYDTLRYWLFVGKDSYLYATHRPSLAYRAPTHLTHDRARRSHGPNEFHDYDDAWHGGQGSKGWSRVQDFLKRTKTRTFTRKGLEPGMQKRVLDQPYDHHLPRDYDHLGF